MKQGGLTPSTMGFTIVETMIVLSITATLAISAFSLISNRQERTEFTVGANTAKQQMQQILNETSSGYFPKSSDIKCTAGVSAPPVLAHLVGSSAQGTNSGCVFLGKAVQLGVLDELGHYVTYPIVGNQLDNSGNQVTSLATAFPEAISAGLTKNTSLAGSGLEQTTAMQNGMQVYSVSYVPATAPFTPVNVTAFGYLSDLSSVDVFGNVNSGAQQFQLYGINDSGDIQSHTELSSSALVDKLYVDSLTDNYQKASQINICLTDGSGRSALIQIGSSQVDAQAAVTLDIRNNGTCS